MINKYQYVVVSVKNNSVLKVEGVKGQDEGFGLIKEYFQERAGTELTKDDENTLNTKYELSYADHGDYSYFYLWSFAPVEGRKLES